VNPLLSPLILLVGAGLVAFGVRMLAPVRVNVVAAAAPRAGLRAAGVVVVIVGGLIAVYGLLGLLLLGL
jgi:hypothetical protein